MLFADITRNDALTSALPVGKTLLSVVLIDWEDTALIFLVSDVEILLSEFSFLCVFPFFPDNSERQCLATPHHNLHWSWTFVFSILHHGKASAKFFSIRQSFCKF